MKCTFPCDFRITNWEKIFLAQITFPCDVLGGMGTNTGQQSQGQVNSKRTIQTRFETEQPTGTATIVGGRVVGGAFGGVASQAAQSSGSSSGGKVLYYFYN